MDPSHMTLDGHMNQHGPPEHDILNLPLNPASMMAADNALSHGLERLFAPCAHDGSCLDHNHHFRQPRTSRHFETGLQPSTDPSQESSLPQQHHSTSPLATRSQDYAWENFLSDSALDNTVLHHGDLGLCDVDDCASECSFECDGSCPSQCGDTGRTICCNEDACGSPQLCLNQDCQGALRPCMDESCLTDTPLGESPSPGHAMTDRDKAAAAALASFGGDGQLQALQPAFAHSPACTSVSSPRHPSSSAFSTETLPCGSLSIESVLTNGLAGFPNQPFQMALEYALASHIVQYHDSADGLALTGTCVANDPVQLISRCTLPKFHPDDGAMDPYLSHMQGNECGFQVQDPNAFAQHIFQEHRPGLEFQFPEPSRSLVGSSASYQPRPRSGYNSNSYDSFRQHFSSSPSPLTNLSVGQSLSTTPSSLTTPSPLDFDAGVAELSLPVVSESSFAAPEPPPSAQKDQFLCRWLRGDGDSICGKCFEDDEQLQKHCKHDHLKQLKKDRGVFRCGWAHCARDTCFTQRSKVERHIQVHTGYKPVRCEVCGQQLSAKQALDQHMRTHTGEKPWTCKFPGCGCAFKQQSALTMHERTHTGDKPLECDICHKRFSESSNLSKHRRTHNVKGMHECQLCDKDFHRLDQLRRHMSTNHKDRPDEVNAILGKPYPPSHVHRVSKSAKAKGIARLKGVHSDTLEVMQDQLQAVMVDQGS